MIQINFVSKVFDFLFFTEMIQEVNAVEQSPIISNGEEFTEGLYNGIKVLKRKSDGFINATKMCNQFGKNFRQIFKNDSFHEYFEEFCLEYGQNTTRKKSNGFVYELRTLVIHHHSSQMSLFLTHFM